MPKEKEIELRSEEIHEILTKPPHVIVRYGITVLCFTFLFIFIGSFFFRYPDVVDAKITITTENPAFWSIAKSSGKIKELLCNDKQLVQQGEILAVLDNPAITAEVYQLKQLLNHLKINEFGIIIPSEIRNQDFELGSIQPSYSLFLKTAIEYENFLTLNKVKQEIITLEKKLKGKKEYLSNLDKQLSLKEMDFSIANSSYQREIGLYERGVISKASFEISEQAIVSKMQEMQVHKTAIAQERTEYLQIEESINSLRLQNKQEHKCLVSETIAAYKALLMNIEQWKRSYVLDTPITGNVTFTAFWKQNQFVNNGDKVFAIVPSNSGNLLGKVTFSTIGSGKVRKGQKVIISINEFPHMQYGYLYGEITNVSLIPNNEIYSAEVKLPNGLLSTNNLKLDFNGELVGKAEIITEDRTLIERITSPILNTISRNFR